MTQFHKWLASPLSGFLLVACFPKLSIHPLVWIALLPLLLVLSTESRPWRAFGWAYLTGAIYFAGSFYWFVEVMRQYGGLNLGLSLTGLAAFVVVFAVFFGSFGLAVGTLARRSPDLALLASPFLWMALELARTYFITGFPWNLLGYSVAPAGLRQAATVTGVYGLSFLAAATSAVAAWAMRHWREKGPWLALGGWVALLVVGNWAFAPPASARGTDLAVLVQPNVPLDEQADNAWVPWLNPAKLNQLVDMSLDALASEERKEGVESDVQGLPRLSVPPLIIWAENPAPFYFTRDPVFRSAVERMARQAAAYVVVNTVIPLASGRHEITNSAIVLDPEGREILQYDKMHLVPFGEYVPAWAFPELIGKITTEAGNFVPGASYGVAPTPQGALGVFICYEDIFPQLVRRVTLAGARVLVNISNDAWFGRSSAAQQELEMARLRAIENRRYLLRATNDGITVLIDPYGRIENEIARNQTAAVAVKYSYLGAETFYTRHGDVFAWLSTAMGAMLLFLVPLLSPKGAT
ncbi:putative Apolipoprotein N-acyltransferase [Acidobacteriia bacterium SbA2]|nr:putative Apolipoprotein N-acyltransferase [Acidobacteriia bacterium SbA2]